MTTRGKSEMARMTDAELDALSEVTPEDVEAARVEWRRFADREWRSILDAALIPIVDDGEEPNLTA